MEYGVLSASYYGKNSLDVKIFFFFFKLKRWQYSYSNWKHLCTSFVFIVSCLVALCQCVLFPDTVCGMLNLLYHCLGEGHSSLFFCLTTY